jgi:hypothetical protein
MLNLEEASESQDGSRPMTPQMKIEQFDDGGDSRPPTPPQKIPSRGSSAKSHNSTCKSKKGKKREWEGEGETKATAKNGLGCTNAGIPANGIR